MSVDQYQKTPQRVVISNRVVSVPPVGLTEEQQKEIVEISESINKIAIKDMGRAKEMLQATLATMGLEVKLSDINIELNRSNSDGDVLNIIPLRKSPRKL